jgi:hypothetical protein
MLEFILVLWKAKKILQTPYDLAGDFMRIL